MTFETYIREIEQLYVYNIGRGMALAKGCMTAGRHIPVSPEPAGTADPVSQEPIPTLNPDIRRG